MMHDQQMAKQFFFGRIWKEITAFDFNLEEVIGDSRENTSVSEKN